MRTIQATVNPRLLTKASRLFTGTLQGRIIEILQNARRAGATTVEITNNNSFVIVKDNGKGIEDFAKVQLRVGKIIAAERVEKSEKLVKLRVDIGTETRQVVAGIGKSYSPEQLLDKSIVIVANLKPAKLMGVESQGMLLAASAGDVLSVVTPDREIKPGAKVK